MIYPEDFFEPDDSDKVPFWELTFWIDVNGNEVEIKDMSTRYIKNVVNYIYKKGFGKQFSDSLLEHTILEELEKRGD